MSQIFIRDWLELGLIRDDEGLNKEKIWFSKAVRSIPFGQYTIISNYPYFFSKLGSLTKNQILAPISLN